MKYDFLNASDNMEMTEPGIELEHFSLPIETVETVENTDLIYGSPELDSEVWEEQSEINSAAISCEKYVAQQLLEREISEQCIRDIAEQKGWYSSERGTMLSDVGNVLEALGLETERETGLTITYLAEMIDNNEKVICAVNSAALYNPVFADMMCYRADHLVEVIGIDASNPNDIKLIINDSRGTHGGTAYRKDVFMKAWERSNCYAVSARRMRETL